MKLLAVVAILCALAVTGCGLGTSDFMHAILDGSSHLNRGKPEKALQDFNRAIEIDPTHFDGYRGRADALNTLGRYAEAIQDYNKALEIKPELATAYVNRAIAYSHLKEYEKAIADYEKGLALDPEIDDSPGIFERIFSNTPNTDKGIRKHLEFLKQQVQKTEAQS